MLGQDAASLKERLRAAEKATSLSAEDIAPYYLKISVQLYDVKGKPSEQGTVEEWWAAGGTDKRVYTMPSYKATEVRLGDKIFRTPGVTYPPALLELLLRQTTHPMPTDFEIEHAQPQMGKIKFDKEQLECVMLAQPVEGLKSVPLRLFPTYCLDPGKDSLRLTYNFGTQLVLRNTLDTFQQRSVAADVVVRSGRLLAASGKVTALQTQAMTDADFATSGLEPVGGGSLHKVASGVVQGLALRQDAPEYPEIAKANHVTGTVILHAVIGTDGHIHELSVMSSPDPDFAIAALTAVRRWVYKPYELFGMPVEVDTTISVNFDMGP